MNLKPLTQYLFLKTTNMKIIITERQNKMLMEGLPVGFRRRYNYDLIKNHLDFSILESVSPCDWDDTGEFVGDMCQMMVEDLLEDYVTITDEKIDYSVKDDLYFFMFDTFGGYLKKFHKQQCV